MFHINKFSMVYKVTAIYSSSVGDKIITHKIVLFSSKVKNNEVFSFKNKYLESRFLKQINLPKLRSWLFTITLPIWDRVKMIIPMMTKVLSFLSGTRNGDAGYKKPRPISKDNCATELIYLLILTKSCSFKRLDFFCTLNYTFQNHRY